ncbi:hypothetical protein TNCV_4550521 [Trichonephila clavipes]|nr:hypothetical protein TNCV_4550521 [Trichonephila clavipes]
MIFFPYTGRPIPYFFPPLKPEDNSRKNPQPVRENDYKQILHRPPTSSPAREKVYENRIRTLNGKEFLTNNPFALPRDEGGRGGNLERKMIPRRRKRNKNTYPGCVESRNLCENNTPRCE